MDVLVADDDSVMALMLSSCLKKAGHNVVVARDAMQTMMAAMRKPPDAILLDVMMPGGNGLQVLRQLKTSVKTALIPIIVITGSVDPATVPTATELGADRCMAKPPDLNRLLSTLQELVPCARN